METIDSWDRVIRSLKETTRILNETTELLRARNTQRPYWCPDQMCTPLSCFNVTGDGTETGNASCIGKLLKPIDHGNLRRVNDLSWCMLSEGKSQWFINQEDCISFVILIAVALKRAGKPLPKWLIESLPKWGIEEKEVK